MIITASKLRSNIYQILDQVLKTGESVSISRHGKIVKLVSPSKDSKLSLLKKRMGRIHGDPERLVQGNWSHEWKGTL